MTGASMLVDGGITLGPQGCAGHEACCVAGASMLVDGGITLGPRHSWDPETPGMFEALEAMEKQAQGQA